MKTIRTTRKAVTFLLVVILSLAVPACAQLYHTPGKASRESVIRQKSEDSQRERTAAPTPAEIEAEKTAGSAVRKNRLPAIGCVAGLLSLNAVAFWCAAKNHERKKCA